MIGPKGLVAGQLLVFVGCDVDVSVAGGVSAAVVIGGLAPGLHVVGADGPVFTTPDGSVLAGRYDFGVDGLPVVGSWRPGRFVLHRAGGGSFDLGPDLLVALAERVPVLVGGEFPVSGDRVAGAPGELVRWMPKKKSKSVSSAASSSVASSGSVRQAGASGAGGVAGVSAVAVSVGSGVREEEVWVSFGDPVRFKRHITSMELKARYNPLTGLESVRLVGGHQLDADGVLEVRDGQFVASVGPVAGSMTEPLVNGVFEASMEYQPLVGGPVVKLTTFFPAHLTWAQVRKSAAGAFRNAVLSGEVDLSRGFHAVGVDSLLGRFVGTDAFGNWLAGYVQAGDITTVFPLYLAPAVPRTERPNPWVARVEAVRVGGVAGFAAGSAVIEASVVEPVRVGGAVGPAVVVSAVAGPVSVVRELSSEVLQDLADLEAAVVPSVGRVKQEKVQAWVDALWGAGRRVLAGGGLTFDALVERVDSAQERVKRVPTAQGGSLVASVSTLGAVLAAERLVSVAASGGPVTIAGIDSVLRKVREAVDAQLLLVEKEEDFRGHAGELLRVLAAVRELGDDWADEEPWPATFSQWLAVLYSTALVERQKGSVPRGVYDQHLQVLANSGIELLWAGELSAERLKAYLGRVVLKQRHEGEQRMWLSDIRYAIGSQDATTVVAAADERLEYLTAEQKRIDDAQGKNPAQRRASGTDDRYTTSEGNLRERIGAFQRDMGQLETRFPALRAEKDRLRFAAYALQVASAAWLARERGSISYLEAKSLVFLVNDLVGAFDAEHVVPSIPYAKGALRAIRTVKTLLDEPDRPMDDATEGAWVRIRTDLDEMETVLATLDLGPQYQHAYLSNRLFTDRRLLEPLRFQPGDAEVGSEFLKKVKSEEDAAHANRRGMPVYEPILASLGSVRDDGVWILAMGRPGGVAENELELRVSALTGHNGKERLALGVTTPYRMMLLLAQVERLRHLAADPEGFVSRLRAKAVQLVRTVQARLLSPSTHHLYVANATSDTPYAVLTASLETLANAWVELVRFGFADEASVREEVARKKVFTKLAERFEQAEPGRTELLFDLHLRVVRGPERAADAKKWRTALLTELDGLVRGRKEKQKVVVAAYAQDSPVRYAGTVLDALVERVAEQKAEPGQDFTERVRAIRGHLQKHTTDTRYHLAEEPVLSPPAPTRVPDELSDKEYADVYRALDDFRSLIPMVVSRRLTIQDIDVASLRIARLVARQSDTDLILRALTLATAAADRALDPMLSKQFFVSLMEYGSPRQPFQILDGIDLDVYLRDTADYSRTALAKGTTQTGHEAWLSALTLVMDDRQWQRDGYGNMTAEELAAVLEEARRSPEPTETLQMISGRAGKVIDQGLPAVLDGYMTVEQFQERLDQLPTDGHRLKEEDRPVLAGLAQLYAMESQARSWDQLPMPEEDFIGQLEAMARLTSQPLEAPNETTEDIVRRYHQRLHHYLSYLLESSEKGGIGLLPRYAAVVALLEELRYRGAVLAEDGVEAVRRFGRWLGALEHAGLEAFRVSPGVMRSAFVRLLSVEVPAGFEERLGVLAARLASPEVLGQPVALDAVARVALRERLREEDVRARVKSPRVGGGQEIRDGVVEVVARLRARVSTVPMTGPDQDELDELQMTTERWLTEPILFEAALENLELDTPLEMIVTPSGYFVPVKGAAGFADDGRAQLQAAFSFPRVGDATVVHVHTDGEGRFLVGNRALDAEEFYREVIEPESPDGQLLVFVGCDVNVPVAGGLSAAEVIGGLAPDLHVVGADGPVFTTPDGAVLAGNYDFDANGRPVAGSWQPARFMLHRAGGGESFDLGSDLLAALAEQVPALVGGEFPVSEDRATQAPGEPVRWMPKKKPKSLPTPAVAGTGQAGPAGAVVTTPTAAPPMSTAVVPEEDIWVSFGDPELFKQHILSLQLRTGTDPFSGQPFSRLVGGHQLDADGTIQVLDRGAVVRIAVPEDSRTEPLSNGVFSATVEYRPLTGGPVTKLTTFYPAHLTWELMKESAAAAYRNAVRSGEINLAGGFLSTAVAGVDSLLGKFVGTDGYGNWLAGYVQVGAIRTAFPLNREPAGARTDRPSPWVLGAEAFVEPDTAAQELLAKAELDMAELTASAMSAVGKSAVDKVQAWVTALWNATRSALDTGLLTVAALQEKVLAAQGRVQRVPLAQRDSLAASVATLRAVLATEALATAVRAGEPVALVDVDTVLSGLRTTVNAQLLLEEQFQGHSSHVLQALGTMQQLRDELAVHDPWPSWFSQWLALLHSSVLVDRYQKSMPRGVYDQHLQTLATHGIALLAEDRLTAADLKKALAQLVLKPRHENEQRMWLSDIRYAIGSQDATTAVEAAKDRATYLADEQKRLNEGQGKNPAQRRASGTDDRYTTWAQAVQDRIDDFQHQIEQLDTVFPTLRAAKKELLFTSHTLHLRRYLWTAREMGYLPVAEAKAAADRAIETSDIENQTLALVKPFAREGLETLRAIRAFIESPADPDQDTPEAIWQSIQWNLDEAEVRYLHAAGGPHSAYAGLVSVLHLNAYGLHHLRTHMGQEAVQEVNRDLDRARQSESRQPLRERRIFRATIDRFDADARWAAEMSKPLGLTPEDVDTRSSRLSGKRGKERMLTGVTSPRNMMLAFAYLGQLSYLTPDPQAFKEALKAKAHKLVRAVSVDMMLDEAQDAVLANVTSNTPYAALTARMETIANAWAELVDFGHADEADVRAELTRGKWLEQLAEHYKLPELGAEAARLLDIHLRIAGAPEQPADAKKWRAGLVAELDVVVRGRKGKDAAPPYTQNSPVRYAGMVLDALVERAARHTPAPGNDFLEPVRVLHKALQKLSSDPAYQVETPPAPIGRPRLPRTVLSARQKAELAGRLDELAAMVPMVLDGSLGQADYDTAAREVARLAARQADPGLVLRAAVLAMLGDRPLEPAVLHRAIGAVLEFGGSGAEPETARTLDLDLIIEALSPMISKEVESSNHHVLTFTRAAELAKNDRAWAHAGFNRMTAEEIDTRLAASEHGGDDEFREAVRARGSALRIGATTAVSADFLAPDEARARYAQLPNLPDDAQILSSVDHVHLGGHVEIAFWHALADNLGTKPMPESEFVQFLDGFAEFVVLVTRESGKAAKPALTASYQDETLRYLSRIRFVQERGGIDLLPRVAAINALEEELRYRGALLAEDVVAAGVAFGRWLGALEHAGLEAFGVAPGVVRSAFVRLLSVEVPEGFGERVGVLAARLASSDAAGAGAVVALGAGEIASLRERLRGEDVRSRSRLPREGGGQEIADGVAEVVARLTARRNEATTAGLHQTVRPTDRFRDNAERLLERTTGRTDSYVFEAALESLESGAVVEPLVTPSGVFVPVRGAAGFADDGRAQLQAAFSFPKVGGATVVHVHTDGAGRFLVGSRALDAADFYREVIGPKGLPDGHLLVFVGCDVNTAVSGDRPAVKVVQKLAPKLHLVSADGPVFTTPDGRVLAGSYRFDVNGVPKPDSWRPGRFTLQPARGAGASADLGSDLIEALQTRVPALLGGTAFPVGTDRGVPAPAELVRWMPKKKSKSGPASQATTPAQQTGSSAASGASPVQAAVSTVHDEDIWVSFGNPERFRQHIVSLELRSSRDPFSGLRIPRLVGGHQLDADGTIPVRDGDAVVRVTVPEG
ncbi:hypothetical protein, partial [Kitasatospora sp. NE20-6]|uniref:hypothetical protein n=1 Tax=Kitasatospora sp. NE20-6 TaxID=2859066 RepID=UPI0038B35F18